jgi:hypothetical protein
LLLYRACSVVQLSRQTYHALVSLCMLVFACACACACACLQPEIANGWASYDEKVSSTKPRCRLRVHTHGTVCSALVLACVLVLSSAWPLVVRLASGLLSHKA